MIWILFVAIVLLVLVQAFLVGLFAQRLSVPKVSATKHDFVEAPVAVILTARGADHHLKDCLAALAEQDWPDYHVWLVVDDPHDPALSVFESIRNTTATWPISQIVAADHDRNRSLKCNSLLFALDHIDTRYEFVALIDADLHPDRNWIRRLLHPFSNPTVGAAYGMRWFSTSDLGMGSLVRAIWNAAAIVQMHIYRIPWGGSLAIRRRWLSAAGISEKWKSALFEDVLITDCLSQQHSATLACNDLVLVSRESTTLRAALDWIARQLLDVRLYHRRWPLVMLHGLAVGGIWLVLVGLIIGSLIAGSLWMTAIGLGLFVMLLLANSALLLWITRQVQRAGEFGGSRTGSARRSIHYLLGVVIAPPIHLLALLRAITMRSVRWRGIDYAIAGPSNIVMRAYQPMSAVPNNRLESESIV